MITSGCRASSWQFAEKLRNQRLAALKGRGFSRAAHRFQWLTARLKPCPFKTSEAEEFFRSHWKAVPFQNFDAKSFSANC